MRIGSTPITDIKVGSTPIIKVIMNGITYWEVTTIAGETYYVKNGGNDSLDGKSDANAWATIATVNSRTFNPGDQVLFKCNNVWRETLTIPSSGNSGAYIVFASYGTGAKPRILGSNQAITWSNQGGNIWKSATVMVDPYATQYYEAEIFFDENGTIAWGVHKINTASLTAEYQWTWVSNYIYVYAATDPGTKYTAVEVPQRERGIFLDNKEYITIDGMEIDFCKSRSIESEYPQSTGHGFIMQNCYMSYVGSRYNNFADGGGSRGYHMAVCRNDMLIKNNEIHDGGRRNTSIHIYGSQGITISGITIEDNILHDGYHSSGVGIPLDGWEDNNTFENIIIRRNLIYDDPNRNQAVDGFAHSEMCSIRASEEGGGLNPTIRNVQIYNNIWRNTNAMCLEIYNVDNISVYNNTFYNFNSHSDQTFHIEVSHGSTLVDIKNNIFYGNNTRPGVTFNLNIYLESTQSASDVAVDYNLFYQTDATMGIIQSSGINYRTTSWATMKTDLVGWQTHEPGLVDPMFTSSSVYTLQASSPAVGAGIDISGYLIDYSGVAVSSPPNIGAFETTTPDIPACVSSLVANATPTLLEMTYSFSLANVVPATSAFEVLVNSVERTVNTVSISTTKVTLTLASAVLYGEVVTVAYIKPQSNSLKTNAGGEVESFTAKGVTNNIAAPQVTSPYTKIWSTWDSSIIGENLADKGDGASLTYSKDNTDIAGKFVKTSSGSSGESAMEITTTTTWQDWGIPSGSTVTNVELLTYDKKLVASTNVSALTYAMYLVDETGTSVTNGFILGTVTDARTTDVNYVNLAGSGNKTISAGKGDTGDKVRLQIPVTTTLSAAGSLDLRFDNVAIKITFV